MMRYGTGHKSCTDADSDSIGLRASNAQVAPMATPQLASNPSIENPPLTPEPIREDPRPEPPDEPENDPVDPDSSPKKVRERGQTALCLENPFCLPKF